MVSVSNIAHLCLTFVYTILIIAQTSIAIQFYNNAREQLESEFKVQYRFSIGILVVTLIIVLLFCIATMVQVQSEN